MTSENRSMSHIVSTIEEAHLPDAVKEGFEVYYLLPDAQKEINALQLPVRDMTVDMARWRAERFAEIVMLEVDDKEDAIIPRSVLIQPPAWLAAELEAAFYARLVKVMYLIDIDG